MTFEMAIRSDRVFSGDSILYLLTYVGIFDLVQTRAVCLDGFFFHCIFVSPYYYYLRGRFLRQAFLNTCLPLGVGVEIVKDVQSKK